MIGKGLCLASMLSLPFSAGLALAEQPIHTPESLLRFLAKGSLPAWAVIRLPSDPSEYLPESPESSRPNLLLDAIFLPAGADRPSDETRRLAEFWIGRLHEEKFAAREEATHRLVSLGTPAIPSLKTTALTHPEPETRNRAKIALDRLSDRPLLADLDYSQVHDSINRLVSATNRPAACEHFLTIALSRLGTPTVHDQESWLLQPFFHHIIEAKSPQAHALASRALDSDHPNLAPSVAATIRRVTTRSGISPIYLAALAHPNPKVVSELLDHAPTLPERSPHRASLAAALDALLTRQDLPVGDRFKVHRIRVIALHSSESLAAIVAAADQNPETLSETLGDPRLVGMPIGDPAPLARLIDHPSAQLRSAAGFILLSRSDGASQRAGLAFLPHLDKESMTQLCNHIAAADNTILKPSLRQIVDDRADGWENAENLLFAIPANPFGQADQNPLFRFR